jgi:hypothetical protein
VHHLNNPEYFLFFICWWWHARSLLLISDYDHVILERKRY